MSPRTGRAAYCAWVAVLAVLYYAVPGSQTVTWALLGFSAAGAAVAGARMFRPARRLPWYLIATGLACFTIGDTAYNVIPSPTFPGLPDLFYLAVYPLLTAALLIFVRARSGGGNDRAALLDASIPTVALGLLAWIYWIAPFTRSHELDLLEKVVSIGYPLGDILALAMLLRLFTVPGRRPRALTALVVALIGLLVSDIFYGQSQLNSAWSLGGPVDVGWVVFYATLGVTALMPSMRELTEPAAESETGPGSAGMSPQRLVAMAAAALIAPAVLFLEWLGGGVTDAPVVAGAAAIMFLLVIARINGLAGAHRRASARELALRRASAALFAAATQDDAVQAVRHAVNTLLPRGEHYRLLFAEAPEGTPPDALRLVGRDALPEGLDRECGDFTAFLHAALPLPGMPGRVGLGVLGARGTVLREFQGSFEALFTQVRVVFERISLTGEVNRRDSEAYFRTLIQNASDVILIVAEDDTIRYASPSAATVFGHDDLAGSPLAALIAVGHHEAMQQLLIGMRHGSGQLDTPDLTVLCADGTLVQVECTGRDLRHDPTVDGLVLTVRDVTERRRLEQDLSYQAYHDGLTGLANRVLFRQRLEQAFAESVRDRASLSVLFVDLDDFKEVNDALGHAVGDQLLVTVGQRIAELVGPAGLAARMGGDEFAVLVKHRTDELAERIAARIVADLAGTIEVGDGVGGSHMVSGAASVGLAFHRDADHATELLRHADLALYQAKGDDKGTWQRYRPELHTAMVERLETRAALHEAVDNLQFRIMYQPIVELTSGVVTGVESLVRWQHPTRGLLGPYHFIEVAEESGAITEIGGWVLREALAQFAAWRADDPATTLQYISVNVSARQFRTPGFVDQVHAALRDTGAEPRWLLLEITESLVLRDADQVWADLRVLRELGVRIAIDDFGTGYSSLSYLREMPVDVLKLDKSFIDDILGSEQQRTMVDTIVTLARNLHLAVVAEGIEDQGQRAALAGMGCPYGQGYLFSKPVWPDAVPALTHGAPARV